MRDPGLSRAGNGYDDGWQIHDPGLSDQPYATQFPTWLEPSAVTVQARYAPLTESQQYQDRGWQPQDPGPSNQAPPAVLNGPSASATTQTPAPNASDQVQQNKTQQRKKDHRKKNNMRPEKLADRRQKLHDKHRSKGKERAVEIDRDLQESRVSAEGWTGYRSERDLPEPI